MALNGVFDFHFGGLRFFPIFLGRVIFMYFPNASDQFLFNSEGGGIKPSFKGVEGWEWLQKMRNSRYSPYGFVSSDFEADRFKCHRF